MLLLLALAFMPLFVLAQTRSNEFIGCINGAPGTPGTDFGGTSTPPVNPSPTSAFACADACVALNFAYSYFQRASSICRCSSTPPPANRYLESTSNGVICAADTSYSTFRLRTTYEFSGCGTLAGSTGTDGPQSTGASVYDCLFNCRFTNGAFVSVTSTNFQCRCFVAPSTGFSIANCGPGAERFFFYSQGRAAATAGLSRKRGIRREAGNEYCPAGLTACRVSGSDEGYECIDTANEFESCGGCVYGQYGSKAQGQLGVNCAMLGDADNMTCKAGRCQVAFET